MTPPLSPEREKVEYKRVRTHSDEHDIMAFRRNSDCSDSDIEDTAAGYDYDDSSSFAAQAKLYVRKVRRRRPLLVTAFASVVIFSAFIMLAFGTYTRFGVSLQPSTSLPPEYVDSSNDNVAAHPDAIVMDDDQTHVLVPVRPLGDPSPLLTAPARPPLDLLIDMYVNGVATRTDPSAYTPPPIDIVYLYVNSSSPYFQAAKEAKSKEEGLSWTKGDAKRYRDNGELWGAVRSGAMSLRDRVRKIHLLSGSFDFDQSDLGEYDLLPSKHWLKSAGMEGVSQWRMGQVPFWLDFANSGKLQYHVHQDIYRLPRDTDGSLHSALSTDEETWRAKALPTFNSFEIESRIGWMKDLSDNFIFSNDDMFLRYEHSVSDFVHPMLGNVVRIVPGFMVSPDLNPELKSTGGEWGGLGNAGALIAARFPHREREYTNHLPKGLSRTIAHEASVMFAAELTDAATRTFRESKRGRADVEFAWLMTHLQIERWREALIWSFVVARVGGPSGVWGADARQEMAKVLGSTAGSVHIVRKKRTTLEDMTNTELNAGWEPPLRTQYIHSSFDGHMPSRRSDVEGKTTKSCIFYNACLPPDFFTSETGYNATEIFKHMAFSSPSCGDCLIDVLMNASGKRGLSAFLPSNISYTPPPRARRQWDREEPMLPLTSRWDDADFALSSVVNTPTDLLEWCVKLLSRYAYVYSTTESRFYLVHSAKEMRKHMFDLSEHPAVSMVCVNDDQPDDANGEVSDLFKAWMEAEFGGESEFVDWERE